LVRGDPQQGIDKLQSFWHAMAATEPWDQLANHVLMGVMTARDMMVLPEVSPYHMPPWGEEYLRNVLHQFFDFEELRVRAALPDAPALQIGAVEVMSGHFEIFSGTELSVECLLASAAIPELFRAVAVPGRGVFWDGLFSQNPPVHELLDASPDELWVIQINPTARAEEPRTVLDITDRRNELAGNLSLYQELHGIEVIDRLLAEGVLVGSRYKHITVRVLEFARPPSTRLLGSTSKLNRDAKFLRALMDQGEQQAEEFLTTLAFERAWRDKDIEAVLGHLAPDVELTAAGPFAGGGGSARDEIADLCRAAAMDLTRKQLTRDRAVWDVRLPEGRGRIEAEIVDGKVTRLGFS
jgi:NTE family protein